MNTIRVNTIILLLKKVTLLSLVISFFHLFRLIHILFFCFPVPSLDQLHSFACCFFTSFEIPVADHLSTHSFACFSVSLQLFRSLFSHSCIVIPLISSFTQSLVRTFQFRSLIGFWFFYFLVYFPAPEPVLPMNGSAPQTFSQFPF